MKHIEVFADYGDSYPVYFELVKGQANAWLEAHPEATFLAVSTAMSPDRIDDQQVTHITLTLVVELPDTKQEEKSIVLEIIKEEIQQVLRSDISATVKAITEDHPAIHVFEMFREDHLEWDISVKGLDGVRYHAYNYSQLLRYVLDARRHLKRSQTGGDAA